MMIVRWMFTQRRIPRISVLVNFERRTRTNQISVAISVVKTGSARPEFPTRSCSQPFGWVGGLLATVRPVPGVGHQNFQRVWRVCENIISLRLLSSLHFPDFLPDRDHGITKTVQLIFGLGFCRLKHQSVSDGPRHCRRMETIILKTFGNIDSLYANATERANIQNKFVRAKSLKCYC